MVTRHVKGLIREILQGMLLYLDKCLHIPAELCLPCISLFTLYGFCSLQLCVLLGLWQPSESLLGKSQSRKHDSATCIALQHEEPSAKIMFMRSSVMLQNVSHNILL